MCVCAVAASWSEYSLLWYLNLYVFRSHSIWPCVCGVVNAWKLGTFCNRMLQQTMNDRWENNNNNNLFFYLSTWKEWPHQNVPPECVGCVSEALSHRSIEEMVHIERFTRPFTHFVYSSASQPQLTGINLWIIILYHFPRKRAQCEIETKTSFSPDILFPLFATVSIVVPSIFCSSLLLARSKLGRFDYVHIILWHRAVIALECVSFECFDWANNRFVNGIHVLGMSEWKDEWSEEGSIPCEKHWKWHRVEIIER